MKFLLLITALFLVACNQTVEYEEVDETTWDKVNGFVRIENEQNSSFFVPRDWERLSDNNHPEIFQYTDNGFNIVTSAIFDAEESLEEFTDFFQEILEMNGELIYERVPVEVDEHEAYLLTVYFESSGKYLTNLTIDVDGDYIQVITVEGDYELAHNLIQVVIFTFKSS